MYMPIHGLILALVLSYLNFTSCALRWNETLAVQNALVCLPQEVSVSEFVVPCSLCLHCDAYTVFSASAVHPVLLAQNYSILLYWVDSRALSGYFFAGNYNISQRLSYTWCLENVPKIFINIENRMVLHFLRDCFVHSSTHSERSVGMKIWTAINKTKPEQPGAQAWWKYWSYTCSEFISILGFVKWWSY